MGAASFIRKIESLANISFF